jgi:hypothetical protein
MVVDIPRKPGMAVVAMDIPSRVDITRNSRHESLGGWELRGRRLWVWEVDC